MSCRRSEAGRRGTALALAGAALLGFGTGAAAQGSRPLSEAEARGKHIYLTGESPSGQPITAFFGEERFELPGTSATCGSCHGSDGTGRPESGIVPTNVTWKYLTKSYGHTHEGGLTHPPFTAETLKHYTLTGVYPGGQPGDPSMPAYEMAEADLDDLLAYLERLGDEAQPGLDEASIRVGTLVPTAGPLAPAGRVVVETLRAYFQRINDQGGIYGRRLELSAGGVGPPEDGSADRLRAWLAEADPFLLVASLTPAAETTLDAVVAEVGLPLIAPVTLYPVEEYALNRHTFFLYPGLAVQARALVRRAAGQGGRGARRLAVAYPAGRTPETALAGVAASCGALEWPEPLARPFGAGTPGQLELVRSLRAEGADTVLHLGVEPELHEFLQAAASDSWAPTVLASGMLSGSIARRVPAGFGGPLYLAYPTLPRDRDPRALAEVRALIGDRAGSPAVLQVSIAAAAAGRVLAEGLRRCGRQLTRQRLEAELEQLFRFETGLTPPITYTRNRRQGINGAYVVAVSSGDADAGVAPGSPEWVELE